MPVFLRVAMVGGAVMGGLAAIFIAGFYAMASGDIGPYSVNGAAVSKEEFLAFAQPVLLAYFVLSLASIALSWSLHRREPRARPLFFGLAAASVVVATGAGLWFGMPVWSALKALVLSALMLGSLWWYLYRDDAVVSWFDALEQRGDPVA
jgi:hypothetical protein